MRSNDFGDHRLDSRAAACPCAQSRDDTGSVFLARNYHERKPAARYFTDAS